MFRGLPWDPSDGWSVPKDWGTTGFIYRTDLMKERPRAWAQFFALFEKYPRKLTLLDAPAEVIGAVALMFGYSFNTEDEAAPAGAALPARPPAARPLVRLHRVHGDEHEGHAVRRARLERRRAGGDRQGAGERRRIRRPEEGGELWVDAYVIPRGAGT